MHFRYPILSNFSYWTQQCLCNKSMEYPSCFAFELWFLIANLFGCLEWEIIYCLVWYLGNVDLENDDSLQCCACRSKCVLYGNAKLSLNCREVAFPISEMSLSGNKLNILPYVNSLTSFSFFLILFSNVINGAKTCNFCFSILTLN